MVVKSKITLISYIIRHSLSIVILYNKLQANHENKNFRSLYKSLNDFVYILECKVTF